jgi:hypothetical protein
LAVTFSSCCHRQDAKLIYHNGKVWKELTPNSDLTSANLERDAVVSESGWFVLAVEGSPANPRADPSYPQQIPRRREDTKKHQESAVSLGMPSLRLSCYDARVMEMAYVP